MARRPLDPQDEPGADAPDPGELVISEEGGVRVFWVVDDTMQGLVERMAVVLSERMRDGDELHVTYNAMQTGWVEQPAEPGGLRRPGKPAHRDILFEYSAFVVLRERVGD